MDLSGRLTATVPSMQPAASLLPSGLYATDSTNCSRTFVLPSEDCVRPHGEGAGACKDEGGVRSVSHRSGGLAWAERAVRAAGLERGRVVKGLPRQKCPWMRGSEDTQQLPC